MYERKGVVNNQQPQLQSVVGEENSFNTPALLSVSIPSKLKEQVWQENREFFITKSIFSKEFYKFSWQVSNLYDHPMVRNNNNKLAFKFLFLF